MTKSPKTRRPILVLLTCGWFVACGGTSHEKTGAAGSAAGAGGGAAGGAGQSIDASVASDGPVYPNAAGKCPMQGAYPRDGGICVCQSEAPAVCDNVCVNTQADVTHCGDCATKCPATSVCNAGKCSAPPTVVLAAPTTAAASCGPLRLAVVGTTLYWTDTLAGTVNSMPTAGGTPALIASAQMAPTNLQVAGGNVFWLDSGEKKIMKSPVGASTPTLVVAAPATDDQIGGFAVSADGLTVYFSSSKPDAASHPRATISKVAAAGGTITVLAAQDHGVPWAVAVDGNVVVYPVNGNGDVNAISVVAGTLAQCGLPPVDGGMDEVDINCGRLGRSQGQLFLDSIFAFGGSAYWLDGESLKTEADTMSIGTYDVITGSIGGGALTALTIDGTTTAYLAEEGAQNCAMYKPDGSSDCMTYGPSTPALIQKAPLMKDATAVPLARLADAKDATKAAHVTSVAVDASNVYYTTDDCAIMKVAK